MKTLMTSVFWDDDAPSPKFYRALHLKGVMLGQLHHIISQTIMQYVLHKGLSKLQKLVNNKVPNNKIHDQLILISFDDIFNCKV